MAAALKPSACCPRPRQRGPTDMHVEAEPMDGSTPEPTVSPADAVLFVTGEIDIASAPGLRDRIRDATVESERTLVVDLSAVTFMDCAGLRPLREAQAALGGRLRLRGLTRPVARLLHLTSLSSRFTVVDAGSAVPDRNPPDRPDDPRARSLAPDPAPEGDAAGDRDLGELRDQVLELHQAIRTRSLIDRAQGLLMAIHGCDGAEARMMLARASHAHHVGVHDLARAVDQADAGTGDPAPAMVEALLDVMTSAAGGR